MKKRNCSDPSFEPMLDLNMASPFDVLSGTGTGLEPRVHFPQGALKSLFALQRARPFAEPAAADLEPGTAPDWWNTPT